MSPAGRCQGLAEDTGRWSRIAEALLPAISVAPWSILPPGFAELCSCLPCPWAPVGTRGHLWLDVPVPASILLSSENSTWTLLGGAASPRAPSLWLGWGDGRLIPPPSSGLGLCSDPSHPPGVGPGTVLLCAEGHSLSARVETGRRKATLMATPPMWSRKSLPEDRATAEEIRTE